MNENTGYTDSISFYLTLHMIDDRMALDPVEFMSFCQQRYQRAFLSYPVPLEGCVEESDLWKGGGFYLGNVATGVRSYPLFWLCQKKVNALYFEKFQKSMYRSFGVEIHGCIVPTELSVSGFRMSLHR
ncbi:hypothetical protein AMECASPLE_038757 [Ameca splendens]|uniref:Uncharacterized protein n=1 Tax=Ameca splendens TaxID=208324 RepID=A0ABV0YJR1_9TELE